MPPKEEGLEEKALRRDLKGLGRPLTSTGGGTVADCPVAVTGAAVQRANEAGDRVQTTCARYGIKFKYVFTKYHPVFTCQCIHLRKLPYTVLRGGFFSPELVQSLKKISKKTCPCGFHVGLALVA